MRKSRAKRKQPRKPQTTSKPEPNAKTGQRETEPQATAELDTRERPEAAPQATIEPDTIETAPPGEAKQETQNEAGTAHWEPETTEPTTARKPQATAEPESRAAVPTGDPQEKTTQDETAAGDHEPEATEPTTASKPETAPQDNVKPDTSDTRPTGDVEPITQDEPEATAESENGSKAVRQPQTVQLVAGELDQWRKLGPNAMTWLAAGKSLEEATALRLAEQETALAERDARIEQLRGTGLDSEA